MCLYVSFANNLLVLQDFLHFLYLPFVFILYLDCNDFSSYSIITIVKACSGNEDYNTKCLPLGHVLPGVPTDCSGTLRSVHSSVLLAGSTPLSPSGSAVRCYLLHSSDLESNWNCSKQKILMLMLYLISLFSSLRGEIKNHCVGYSFSRWHC